MNARVYELGVGRGTATGRSAPSDRDFEWLASKGEWDLLGSSDPQVGVDFAAGMAAGAEDE